MPGRKLTPGQQAKQRTAALDAELLELTEELARTQRSLAVANQRIDTLFRVLKGFGTPDLKYAAQEAWRDCSTL